jgi:hypothetical protein
MQLADWGFLRFKAVPTDILILKLRNKKYDMLEALSGKQ